MDGWTIGWVTFRTQSIAEKYVTNTTELTISLKQDQEPETTQLSGWVDV